MKVSFASTVFLVLLSQCNGMWFLRSNVNKNKDDDRKLDRAWLDAHDGAGNNSNIDVFDDETRTQLLRLTPDGSLPCSKNAMRKVSI